ncbi:dihydroorotase family protein [Tianweitania sp. BSSL-BM11]|uniref:Dihydroorotase family protein n=1 Tax=Tianweitania aestuarii TaxID=2814886 RepID=A0ABS5RYD8_9HYPH|nr:dihydroorotase family protein [Tianweitania aestuarii]MBS9721805.1 dihydroorotase family protein [Tianweitania aestuarii]
MAAYDLVIRDVEAVLPASGRTACDIAIRDGQIAAILLPGSSVEASEILDGKGLVALPGVIDCHLHLGHGKDISRPREPKDADVETASAALGGVTCMIPFLMSSEPHAADFGEVKAVTEAGARIDFGYHFIISTEAQLAEVPDYISKFGAPTLKIFMNNRGGEGKRLNLPDIDDGFLFRLAEAAAQHGGMVAPHPENIEIAWVLRDRAMKADPDGQAGLASWDASRPDFVEAEAVQRASYVANVAGAPLYVVHTSSAAALEAGLARRDAGDEIYFETCPHYLTHDITDPIGEVAKINPPLRSRDDCERLWQAIEEGDIDTVATDHVHRDISSKANGIWAASPGCPGMETLLPVMLTEGYHGRGIPLERLVEVLSETPARLMGLDVRKGTLSVGKDADIVLLDLNAEWTLTRDKVASSAGYSIYEGKTFKGAIQHTFVRGHTVVRDGNLTETSAGIGRYQHRKLGFRG